MNENIKFFSTIKQEKKKRNLGIDIARILAIFFIINLHIIYHGGPLSNSKFLSADNNILLFFNTLFCSGVNIFGMISGFVGFSTHKFSNLFYLLIQTFFYNYGIAFYFKVTKKNIVTNLKKYIYPLFISDYWYFNAYFSLYFFLPLINSGIKSMEKREMGNFNLSIFLLFSCFNQTKNYSNTLRTDFFFLRNGFTYIWLIILYFYGSYFGRFNGNSHKYNKVIIFVICNTLIIILVIMRNKIIIYKIKKFNNDNGMKVEYTSPSCVIIAICFIMIFSKLNINSKLLSNIISFFAPLTFGIYLLHNHELVRKYYIQNKYTWLLKYHSLNLILIEMFESLKIFVYCSLVDYLRLLLFKLIKIRKISSLIDSLLNKTSNNILFLFELLF